MRRRLAAVMRRETLAYTDEILPVHPRIGLDPPHVQQRRRHIGQDPPLAEARAAKVVADEDRRN